VNSAVVDDGRHVTGLLTAGAGTLAEHRARLGLLPALGTRELLDLVAASGLTGRGGAGFPTVRKLALVAGSPRAVVVANGAEGEPASSKDRVLLIEAPHLVLDGLELAARATRATRSCLAAPADLLDTVVAPALAERRGRVRLVAVPEGYVTGQETAVVAATDGRAAKPFSPVEPLWQRGVAGRPTVVLNVETLAHLALIARFGAPWFVSLGTPEDPGSRLVTISGAVRWPGVWEAPGGSTLGDVLGAAGGPSEPLQAVLVGGYHGGWVPWSRRTAALPLTRAGLEPHGAAPGAGVLIALPSSRCGLRAAAGIATYLAGETAGQCGPCLNGLPALARHLDALARGREVRHSVAELERLAAVVDGRGTCRHPDGTARFVRSTLRAFHDEVSAHQAGHCRVGTPSEVPDGPQDDGRMPWPPS
jgi:NADH:ubiquinone oxidoreductase subunit F (NADH-binding)